MRIVAYRYCNVENQSSELPESFAAWTIDRVYQDFAIQPDSMLDVGSRSQLQQFFQDCDRDPADMLLVQSLMDLGNSFDSIRAILDRCQTMNCVVQVSDNSATTGAPIDQLEFYSTSDMLEHAQTINTQLRSRSIRDGHARKRLKALPPPGRVPYGYLRSDECYTLDPATAPIVKALFDQFLLFGSVRGAARYVTQKYGKTLSPSTVLRWLTSPVYRGHLDYCTGDIISNTHTAIMGPDESAQIDRLLQRNRRMPKRSASSERSLSGLVICQACASPMTIASVKSRKKSKPTYLYLKPTNCKSCIPGIKTCGTIAYDQVLQQIIDRICDQLPKAIAPLPTKKLQQLRQQIDQQILQKQTTLQAIPDLEAQQIFDAETATLRSYKLRAEISVLQSNLSKLPPSNLISIAETVSIPEFWIDLSETERRFYLREFLQRVELVRTSPPAYPSSAAGWTVELVFTF